MHKKIVVFEDGSGFGGAVLALLENLRYLLKKDFEFILIHNLEESRFKSLFSDISCHLESNIIRKWTLKNKIIHRLFERLNLYLAINVINSCRFLIKHKPDLVYANNDLECNLHAVIAAKLLCIPVVVHERDIAQWSRTTKFFYSSVKAIIAISEASRMAIIGQGYPAKKIKKIIDGIDITSLINNAKSYDCVAVKKNYSIPLNKKIILMVGMIIPWKGQLVLLEAAKLIKKKRSDLHFVLVGEPPSGNFDYQNILNDFIKDNSLQEYVSMLGLNHNIGALIHASDLIVHASINPEPFGRVVVEGMVLGKTVIATNMGGPSEIIQDKINGLLIQANKPDILAATLAEIIDEPQRLVEMGEAARKRAMRYDAKEVANRVGEVLSSY